MNSKKIVLLISSFIFCTLFCVGVYALVSLPSKKSNNGLSKPSNNLFSDIAQDANLTTEQFNLLLVGDDVRGENTDTMMLLNFDPFSKKINLLSIPRDTRVKVNYKKASYYTKINGAYYLGLENRKSPTNEEREKGMDLCVETVKKLLNVDIQYYALIDITIFRSIIDELEGVDIDIPCKMDYDDSGQDLHIHFNPGLQHLNGLQAEQYMRFRKSNGYINNQFYDGSDLKRIDAQQNLLKEIVKQKANAKYIPKANNIINIFFEKVITNMKLQNFAGIANILPEITMDKISFYKLDGITPDIQEGKDVVNYFVFTSIIDNTTKKNVDRNKVLKDCFMQKTELPPFKKDFVEASSTASPSPSLTPSITQTMTNETHKTTNNITRTPITNTPRPTSSNTVEPTVSHTLKTTKPPTPPPEPTETSKN